MRCIAIDDDPLSLKMVEKCVEKTEDLEMTGLYTSPLEAIDALKSNPCDLVILDIEMPEMTGLELMRSFPEIPQVIIASSKSEYAVEAFDFNVTDYLVKPLNYARFLKAIEKARTINENLQLDNSAIDHVFVKKKGRLVRIDLDQINYIEALSDFITIYTDDERFTILSTMKAVEAKLPSALFVRVHRSYIVKLDKIREIDDSILGMGEKAIPVSRSYKPLLKKRLNML